MKFATERPYADPEKAARNLVGMMSKTSDASMALFRRRVRPKCAVDDYSARIIRYVLPGTLPARDLLSLNVPFVEPKIAMQAAAAWILHALELEHGSMRDLIILREMWSTSHTAV